MFGGPPQHANVLETPALREFSFSVIVRVSSPILFYCVVGYTLYVDNPPSPPKDGSISLTDDLRYAKVMIVVVSMGSVVLV